MIRDWQPCDLTRRERRALCALVEALYDPHGTGKIEPALRHILDEVQAWLAAPDFASRTALRALLVVMELAPIRFGFGARTMSGLPLHERARYVALLDAHSATSLNLWKTLLGTAYFAHPIGASELGCEEPSADGGTLHHLGRARARAHAHRAVVGVAGATAAIRAAGGAL